MAGKTSQIENQSSQAMLHHLSFAVTDIARSGAFYDAVLAPLGYGNEPGKDVFALKLRPDNASVLGDGFHVAFAAPWREAVGAFHAAALANGGRDNGGTGLHPEYGPGYFAAFVFDPDGYRIEAVICGESSDTQVCEVA
ncbi:MAG: glyoxalase [Prosthecobacter sp.]|nr:glyoxalase [Prosthecobacter sp.]